MSHTATGRRAPRVRASTLAWQAAGLRQRAGGRRASRVAAAASAEQAEDLKSSKYTEDMQARMNTSLTYNHEAGMNYHSITPDVTVGSCPQTAADVDRLAAAGMATIICLQQDTDMAYFNLDIEPIERRCEEVGIRHVRARVNDFDPFHLRLRLPDVVRGMAAVQQTAGGTFYIHCTAGMGRAPAVALAYLWWYRQMHLEEAHELLLSKRRCVPKLYAIRQAAADILYGGTPQDITITKKGTSLAENVDIAGLDVGWGNRLPMQPLGGDRWQVTRQLPPGAFPYKFIMDGRWSYDADLRCVFDGENTNNVVEVIPFGLTEEQMRARARVLTPDGRLTDSEARKLFEFVCQDKVQV